MKTQKNIYQKKKRENKKEIKIKYAGESCKNLGQYYCKIKDKNLRK